MKKYGVDIATLQETHLKETGQLEEPAEGYTFLWSGCKPEEPNHYGVAICVKSSLLQSGVVSEPHCINDRIMFVNINGEKESTTLISCYAPTLQSTDLEKEIFYNNLKRVYEEIPRKNNIIIGGDFNARVGNKHDIWKGALGKYGTGKENTNGHLLLQFCIEKNLTIVNTMFKQKAKFKNTWQHPRSKEWHTIDYVLTKTDYIRNALRCRVMRGAECSTDHRMIRADFKMKPKKHRKTKKGDPKLDMSLLKTQEYVGKYQSKLETIMSSEFHQIQENQTTVEEEWNLFKHAHVEAAKHTLPKLKNEKRDWYRENNTAIEETLKIKDSAYQRYLSNPSNQNKAAVLQSVVKQWYQRKST
ncbi:hypothetical protein M8J76_012983 [Diaphorina citri]|nr:hypothetical protein M8J76_012983 [Diaphorina citri]